MLFNYHSIENKKFLYYLKLEYTYFLPYSFIFIIFLSLFHTFLYLQIAIKYRDKFMRAL